jgi:hypothetical protein
VSVILAINKLFLELKIFSLERKKERKTYLMLFLNIHIFSVLGNIIAAVIVSLTGILPVVISNTNPSQLGIYPNYILVYVHHLVVPGCVISISIFFFYFNNEHLKKLFKKQFKM